MSLKWLLRYVFSWGWLWGFLAGASLIRAVESGGEWWVFFPLVIVLAVAFVLTREAPSS